MFFIRSLSLLKQWLLNFPEYKLFQQDKKFHRPCPLSPAIYVQHMRSFFWQILLWVGHSLVSLKYLSFYWIFPTVKDNYY